MRQLNHIRWLVAVVVLATLPVVAQVSDTLYFSTLSRTVEAITVGQETFSRYSYPGCDHIDQVGAPMLPVKYIRLSVPYNATNIRVTTPGSSYLTQPVSRRIYPAPVPLTTNDTVPDTPELVIDSAIYKTDAFWPPLPAQLVGDGFYMGENRIITVAVRPMLYNPITSKVRTYSQVRVNVIYDLGGTPGNMLVRRGGDLRQQEQQSAKAMVENPQQVEGFAMPVTQAHHMPAHGLVPDSLLTDTASYYYGGELYTWGDRARYLIVTTRDLAPSFKRLAALKRQKGYSVQIKCIEDILADPRVQHGDVFVRANGDTISFINDDPGKLRQYLKLAHAYDNTQFVLLGGKDVPFRSNVSLIKDSLGCVIGHDSIPTDLYYTDITYAWAKSSGCNPEFYWCGSTDGHDLFVGRLMADSIENINNYTDKLMRYELNPGHGDRSYLGRCLVVEGSELNPKISTGTIMSNAYSPITPNITLIKQQGHNYPTGGEVISLISENKYGVLSIHGHGNPYATAVNDWNTWYLDSNNDTVHTHHSYQRIASLDAYYSDNINNGLDCLVNKYYPGIYYSWSCDNAPFDNFQRSYFKPYDCNMAQSFILGKDYGGVAFLGNTRLGYYSPGDNSTTLTNSPKVEKNFAELLGQGIYRLSEAEAISKEKNHGGFYDSKILLGHNLHGDPEFELWTNIPNQLCGINIVRSDNSVSVSNLPISDSIKVALCPNNATPIIKMTTTGNTNFLNINPNSTIMVYRHNCLPYIAPLYLQNERISHSQYVIANDVYAGRNVDSNRTTGDLTIAAGIEYELDAKGQVVLSPGFKVEKGALFSVIQSDY